MSIAEKVTALQNARNNIRAAINNKGGSLSDTAGFESFAEAVSALCVQEEWQFCEGGIVSTGQDLEGLVIELGFRPSVFIIFGSGITAADNAVPYPLLSAFCVEMPDAEPVCGASFVIRNPIGVAQGSLITDTSGLSFNDNGVTGKSRESIILQNGKFYSWFAFYR